AFTQPSHDDTAQPVMWSSVRGRGTLPRDFPPSPPPNGSRKRAVEFSPGIAAMTSLLQLRRRRRRRSRPRLEQLEPRLALSADGGVIDPGDAAIGSPDPGTETSTLTQTGPFTVGLTDPSPGSVQSTSPTT